MAIRQEAILLVIHLGALVLLVLVAKTEYWQSPIRDVGIAAGVYCLTLAALQLVTIAYKLLRTRTKKREAN